MVAIECGHVDAAPAAASPVSVFRSDRYETKRAS